MRSVLGFIRERVGRFLTDGKERTVRAKKNILGSILIKGGSIVISLVIVPLTIDYVNPTRYGIWLTLSSIVGWFSFFNVGLTHGLRNKFAESRAKGDIKAARMYVSTTYFILALIFTVVWVVFLIVNPFLDWVQILNVTSEMRNEVSTLAVIVFTYFCLQFVLRIINTMLTADQHPAKGSLIDLLGQVFSLLFIVVLVKTTEGSLVNLGMALCLSPILILVGANLFFFRGTYQSFRPSWSAVDLRESKGLFNLGLVFFIISIAGLIQYQSANIIIAQNFGTYEVTSYNIVYKYFNILGMAFGIFLSPFWSASTDAFLKNDIAWIRTAIQKYMLLIGLLVFVGVGMLLISPQVYEIWLKGQVQIDFILSFWGFMFILSFMFGNLFVNFLNGISALRIQFWCSILSPIVYIGVAILMIKYYEMGVYSLFIASLIANFNGILIAPIQYYLIVYKKRRGIWIK
ncbi:MAG: MATE family efflux transporter [Lunatimonas sp.]|uniref:MATE family efflux transporter n=1 Tax=Lunatimonas sp. TaxID=2060141 RepID=UPI00263A5B92|nr:MATE family efflux transporter [Lunatimonas sp.]MCC5939707.1 MATE family efflux transporter [Lunatimonas sp.]